MKFSIKYLLILSLYYLCFLSTFLCLSIKIKQDNNSKAISPEHKKDFIDSVNDWEKTK
jgi:hypothetical protein